MIYKPLIIAPLLNVAGAQVKVKKRGFDCSDKHLCNRLEEAGRTFLLGYHLATKGIAPQETVQIQDLSHTYSGFAFESVAMGFLTDISLEKVENPKSENAYQQWRNIIIQKLQNNNQ